MKTSIDAPWGDSIDTVKHSQSLDAWYKEHTRLPYNHFRLPSKYSFDLEEMRQHVQGLQTISIQANANGRRFSRYRGLGFFARPDSESPLEDHFVRRETELGQVYPDDLHLNDQLPNLKEDDFTEPTDILNDYFCKVFSIFNSPISKASLLDLRSGGWLGSHVDFPYYKTIRLHASIKGCGNAWYEIDGERFQIPEDGHWYFIDTGKYHAIWNHGPEHRLTLNVNLVIGYHDPQQLANLGQL